MTSSANRTAFLLGSGASRPAGFPSVEELTRTILSGDAFLRDLCTRFDSYYQQAFGRGANYEDLFYVASQLQDELAGEVNDPIVATAIETLRLQCKFDPSQLTYSLDYISDMVASSLWKPATRLDHLQFLKAAWEEAPLQTLDIFTVNHDLLLEQYSRAQDIPLVDGFDAAINNVRYWNPTLFRADAAGIRLLKLHGSIGWYRFQPYGSSSWYDDLIGIYQGRYPSDARSPGGIGLLADKQPLLLIGTFNKISEYTRRIFLDLYYEFRRLLDRSTILISCGYGFADKGINEQILEWVYGDRKRRIVLIEPTPEGLKQRARPAIARKWEDEWCKDGTLTIIQKGIEEVSWDEVK